MKKIILLVLLSFNFSAWSQTSSYRYHELEDLGIYIENAISIHCAQTYAPYRVMEVNFRQNYTLEVGQIYKADLGLSYGNFGTRYYRVKYAAGYGVDKGDEVDTPVNFGSPIDVCNALSWKYVRPILLGSTLQEAKDNYCSGQTANSTREKVNIKIESPLTIGNVYLMDFGLGSNYYIIYGANVEKGDSDYDLDTTSSTAVFSFISEATINCPKPDLQANSISLTGSTNVSAGSAKTANYQITNIGGYADTSQCQFYLSKDDAVLSSNDVLIKQINIAALNTNEIKNGSTSLTIPSTTVIGNYYIIMKVNNNTEINLSNNTTSFLFSVTAPAGFADLTINKNNVYIYSNCSDCNSNLGSLGSKRHILNRAYSGILNIQQIIIDNIGAVTSTNSNLKFYLSTNATLSSDDYYFNNRDVTLTSISPNDYLLKQQSIFAVDIPSNKAYGNYHILIVIDKDGSVNEGPNGGENNNLITIPISYINMTNRTPPTLDKNQFNNIQKNNNELITKSYDLSIYDFSGTLIKFSTINSLEQESEIISTLPSGLYIIKTPLETRKISK
ncbi:MULTISPECIES: T9SS type A sorting domain-containing protein [Flavobacterium]|uniref:T9SS type A sorting domain-containing protein n=1 Tax=Flavobacterium jumunjinense TaxID=998845 RepID=A0ABV5GLB7_9FLAO|nr:MULTISPECIES: T9SS type A sorting domain-containing protein [Flavobacterium]